jgi:ubiquinone/menaquinone biosynthesis C-methylase UbiE
MDGDLVELADRLILVDISPVCLDLCRARFADRPNVAYVLTNSRSLPSVDDRTVNFIWSYDTFVHINPSDTDAYMREFVRVMKEGVHAALHHPGRYQKKRRPGFRSNIDAEFFRHLANKHGAGGAGAARFPGAHAWRCHLGAQETARRLNHEAMTERGG